jgi:hypothetical protein
LVVQKWNFAERRAADPASCGRFRS